VTAVGSAMLARRNFLTGGGLTMLILGAILSLAGYF
jgi:hypothetical protein